MTSLAHPKWEQKVTDPPRADAEFYLTSLRAVQKTMLTAPGFPKNAPVLADLHQKCGHLERLVPEWSRENPLDVRTQLRFDRTGYGALKVPWR